MVGLSISWRCPLCPFFATTWPLAFLPWGSLVVKGLSVDGGWLELLEFWLSLTSSAATRFFSAAFSASRACSLSSRYMRSFSTRGGVCCRSSSVTSKPGGSRRRSTMELLPKITAERIEKHRLGLIVAKVTVAALGGALGGAHITPVRRPITGPPEAGLVHKGFQQDNGLAIVRLPVRRQTPDIGGQHVRGQVLNLHPGQDQKPDIVGHQGQVLLTASLVPADEGISASHPPGRRPPPQAGHQPAIQIGQIFQVGAHDPGTAQIMVGVDQVIPELLPGGTAHHVDCQKAKLGNASRQRLRRHGKVRSVRRLFAPIVVFLAGRKFDLTPR